ncbi:opsin-VA-like [Ostrea edulis]|uniref:opsin-VA-like n=1 Tax=Ostrea edulis TaxID=37623 RepID=UPI0024AECA27|nr:opsin-VA-like [Ostrea edulis]
MTAIGTSFTCLAHFFGKWMLYSPVCQIQGSIMTFLGLSQIVLLSCISFTRYLLITDPRFRLRSLHARLIVCSSYGFCLVVALCPILGWSYYTHNASGMSCEPVWGSSDGTHISYNIFMLVVCFAIPLLTIVFSYIMIFIKVKCQSLKQNAKRIAVTHTILIMIVFFLLSWVPYTVYSVFRMSGSNWDLNPNLVCIPGVFAKSSALWNPIIYFLRNSEFRKQCIKHIRCLQRFSYEQRTPATHYIIRRGDTEIKLIELIPGKETSL